MEPSFFAHWANYYENSSKNFVTGNFSKFMSQLLKKVVGKNGAIELYEDRVIVNRKKSDSYLFQGLIGKASLSINEIASIRFKKAGFLGNGSIRINIKGGLLQAMRDDNIIIFRRAQNQSFKEIKEMIEERM